MTPTPLHATRPIKAATRPAPTTLKTHLAVDLQQWKEMDEELRAAEYLRVRREMAFRLALEMLKRGDIQFEDSRRDYLNRELQFSASVTVGGIRTVWTEEPIPWIIRRTLRAVWNRIVLRIVHGV